LAIRWEVWLLDKVFTI